MVLPENKEGARQKGTLYFRRTKPRHPLFFVQSAQKVHKMGNIPSSAQTKSMDYKQEKARYPATYRIFNGIHRARSAPELHRSTSPPPYSPNVPCPPPRSESESVKSVVSSSGESMPPATTPKLDVDLGMARINFSFNPISE